MVKPFFSYQILIEIRIFICGNLSLHFKNGRNTFCLFILAYYYSVLLQTNKMHIDHKLIDCYKCVFIIVFQIRNTNSIKKQNKSKTDFGVNEK